ncbi:MAG: glyoxalase [Anaerolineae bacterium]|nr:glyoxalase [Anaerolineae bacterium]NUQ07071.1 glyoxalase [Anaerolineae bacterium]
MNHGVRTLVYPVKDLNQAKALYTELLGGEPYVDTPYYVGWKLGGLDIGLDPNGHSAGLTGPVNYYHVDDINASLQTLLASGAHLMQAAKDVGNGSLVASVKDADGNIVGLLQESSDQSEGGAS